MNMCKMTAWKNKNEWQRRNTDDTSELEGLSASSHVGEGEGAEPSEI